MGETRLTRELTLTNKHDLLEQQNGVGEELLRSFCYSALQSPMSGAAQLIDHASADIAGVFGCSGTSLLPKVQFMAAPKEAAFGTKEWHAQQVGSAAGLAADLIGVSLLMHRGPQVNDIEKIGKAEFSAFARKEIGKGALTGALLGGVFTPVRSDENFWQARGSNALTQGLTFSALTAGSVGLKGLGQSLERQGRFGGKLLGNEILSNVLAGIPAGIVHANSDSVLHGKGLAGAKETAKSVYAFATVGGLLGTYGAATELAFGRRPSAPEKSAESRPGEPVPAQRAAHDPVKVEPSATAAEKTVPGAEVPAEFKVGERSRKVLDDGTVVLEMPPGGSNGTRRILTRTDGTKIYERVDGSKKTLNTDGSKVTEFPPRGEIKQVTERLDGSRTTEYWLGEKSTTYKDGTVVTEYPSEGKTITEKPDGTITTDTPARTVVDVSRVDLVQEKLVREIRTTDKKTGQTKVEYPELSRQGDYMMLDGHLGRRKVTFAEPAKGERLQHESIEFSRGPVSKLERRSDGTWMKEYREGGIRAEGQDVVNGELVRFLSVNEGCGAAAVRAVRQAAPKDVIYVRGDHPAVTEQFYRPDGRVETIYEHNAWKQDGQYVSTETIYPDGSVARNYTSARGTADSALAMSNGITWTELRRNFVSDDAPTFELKGPDGSTFNLKGGEIDTSGNHANLTGETNGRLPLNLDGAPQRYSADGQYMTPYDVYEGKAGSMRYLYKDGTIAVVTQGGRSMEIKFVNGPEVQLKQNGSLDVTQKNGAKHVTEFGKVISYTDSANNKRRFE